MSLHRVNLSIQESYSPSWQLWEGVREMVGNWYDGLLETRESFRKTIYNAPKLEIKVSTALCMYTMRDQTALCR